MKKPISVMLFQTAGRVYIAAKDSTGEGISDFETLNGLESELSAASRLIARILNTQIEDIKFIDTKDS